MLGDASGARCEGGWLSAEYAPHTRTHKHTHANCQATSMQCSAPHSACLPSRHSPPRTQKGRALSPLNSMPPRHPPARKAPHDAHRANIQPSQPASEPRQQRPRRRALCCAVAAAHRRFRRRSGRAARRGQPRVTRCLGEDQPHHRGDCVPPPHKVAEAVKSGRPHDLQRSKGRVARQDGRHWARSNGAHQMQGTLQHVR